MSDNQREIYEGGSEQDQPSSFASSARANPILVPEEFKTTLQFSGTEPPKISNESVTQLKEKMQTCDKALQYAKLLIQNYKDVFEQEIKDLEHNDGNELIKRNYV